MKNKFLKIIDQIGKCRKKIMPTMNILRLSILKAPKVR